MLHMSSSISSTIFYACIFSKLLCIARYTVRIKDFTPTASDLFPRMTAQVEKRATLTKQLKRSFIFTRMFFKNLVKLMRK